MTGTSLKVGSKTYKLKYARKMPQGEIMKMKSFVTSSGKKLMKGNSFKIVGVKDTENTRIYNVQSLSFLK